MNVLVGYATAFGSTQGIAKRIGDRLGSAGLTVEVRPLAQVTGLESFEAVVLGSAIHDQRWLPEASGFIRQHAAVLRQRAAWLFSVSSIGETSSFFRPAVARRMRTARGEPKGIAEFRRLVGFRGHRDFAGAVQPDHWPTAGRIFFRVFGGRYGDHRDWRDIDAWADEIAHALNAPLTDRER